MSGRVLLLDVDGTVCVGDGPALRYTDEVAARLDGDGRAAMRARLAAFLRGDGTGAEDVYQLVQEVAAAHGPTREELTSEAIEGIDPGPVEAAAEAPPSRCGCARRCWSTRWCRRWWRGTRRRPPTPRLGCSR